MTNQRGHKHYVVNVQTIAIDSGWADVAGATQRMMEMVKAGTPAKVMTKPRIGFGANVIVLDPADEASWAPKRRANPSHDTAKGDKVFRMWHRKEPNGAQIVRPGAQNDDVMVCVGLAFDIVYRSKKWEKGNKTNDYVHTFDSKPKVWMLASCAGVSDKNDEKKTVETLLKGAKNADGQFACADLASPISLSVDSGDNEIAIHSGARVYGAVDQKTVIIVDPKWKIIVIKGGEMYFDERGIVK